MVAGLILRWLRDGCALFFNGCSVVAMVAGAMVAAWLRTPLATMIFGCGCAMVAGGCGSCGHGRVIVARRHPRPVGDETPWLSKPARSIGWRSRPEASATRQATLSRRY